jgi:CheY-like chemotaxis protein/two-component sensor histidine kinase
MEAVGQLAGGIAHDFNNALTAILSYAELALANLRKSDPIRADIDEIRAAGERAASLTRQILAFSRQQVLSPVVIDLNDLIRGLLNLLSRTLGEHVELEFSARTPNCLVHVDPHQMEQVIINLCVNARDAMPDGGRIEIATNVEELSDETVRARSWPKPGRYVVVTLADNGVGMPPEVLEHAFEPFFTTKEVGKGTGLGLATVYGIVKQHDGAITAESSPDSGSRFRIYLPHATRAPVAASGDVQTLSPTGSETLLLAEDDELVRTVALRILRGAGYDVLVATDGEEAVKLFQKHDASIALVVLDVVMPRVGGRAALELIRALRPDVKFLLCSGYTRTSEAVALTPDEQSHWVSKPYNAHTLLRRVRAELDMPPEPPSSRRRAR